MQKKTRTERKSKKTDKKQFLKNRIIISGSAVILILAIFVSPAVYSTYFSTKTASGMTILDTSIGGLSMGEVEEKLDEEIAKPRVIKVLIEEKSVDLDLNSAGFMIDKEKTLEEIKKNGKKGFFENMFSKNDKKPIKVEINSDIEQFDSVMDTLLAQANVRGDAFTFVSEDKSAKVTINTDNKVVDKEQLFNDILNSYNMLATEYSACFSEPKLPTAKEIADAININAEDARVENDNGQTKVIPHKVGVVSDEDVIAEKLKNGDKTFSVPLKLVNPKIYTDDLGDSTFPHLLYKFSTSFSEGDAGRTTNVKLATNKINGQILNNGDVFSFNKVVGQRSYENGFKDANVFLADQVVKDVGGGICQVSSTLYAAVLYADLKIVERRNHNFTVAYAKAGVDATVSYGSIDFKFQNNMKAPIKIKASASGGQMIVSIFGTKENENTVEITTSTLGTTARGTKYIYNAGLTSERVTQSGSDGCRVQTTKTVKDGSGKVIRTDNLGISNYVPLIKIVETGDATKVAGAVPEPTPDLEANPIPGDIITPLESGTPTASPEPVQSQEPTETPEQSSDPVPSAESTVNSEAAAQPTAE